MTRRALITGISGQDGSYLADFLLQKGYEVHGVLRRSSNRSLDRIDHLLDAVHLHEADITDLRSLISVLDVVQLNEVYNLAALLRISGRFQTCLTSNPNSGGNIERLN